VATDEDGAGTGPETGAPQAADAQRINRIEREQERQGGILDRIVGILGSSRDDDDSVTRGGEPALSAGDMAEQMRQAVRDVRAEEAAAAKTEPATPAPETAPREVAVRGKDRLQAAIFGKNPK
jgi:hypothetical protein